MDRHSYRRPLIPHTNHWAYTLCRPTQRFLFVKHHLPSAGTRHTINQEQKPVCSLKPIEDPREIVQKRGQRVHHTKVLHSPWYGQHQSPTGPGFLEVTKDVKLNWNLENKELATLINLLPVLPFSFLQLFGWWQVGCSCSIWLLLDQLAKNWFNNSAISLRNQGLQLRSVQLREGKQLLILVIGKLKRSRDSTLHIINSITVVCKNILSQ